MAGTLLLVDLETYEPTEGEIISWHEMMVGADQLRWEYDASWAEGFAAQTREKKIESFRERRAGQRGANYPLWAIVDGRVVGMIGINRLEDTPRRHCGELGFGVGGEFTRRGIGERLVRAAIEKARQLGLKRLQADCMADNAASIALLRKCGFAEEGVRVRAIQKDGGLRDERLFGLML